MTSVDFFNLNRCFLWITLCIVCINQCYIQGWQENISWCIIKQKMSTKNKRSGRTMHWDQEKYGKRNLLF